MTRVEAWTEIEYPEHVAWRPVVYYPESDGEPMAETDVHISTVIYLREALRDHFRDAPQVYVAGNLFLYYVEGNPTQVVAPDVFVVFGVPKGDRRVYKVWEEGKGPDVVFEVTSASTSAEDLGPKKGTYEMLGVREYFIFDPLVEYLEPQVLGFRLGEQGYRKMEEGPLISQVLGLELRVEGRELRLYDVKTSGKLLSPLEAQASRRTAEAEVEYLRAELARLQGE